MKQVCAVLIFAICLLFNACASQIVNSNAPSNGKDTANTKLIKGKLTAVGGGSSGSSRTYSIEIRSEGKIYSCRFPVEDSRSVLGEDVKDLEALSAKNLTGKYVSATLSNLRDISTPTMKDWYSAVLLDLSIENQSSNSSSDVGSRATNLTNDGAKKAVETLMNRNNGINITANVLGIQEQGSSARADLILNGQLLQMETGSSYNASNATAIAVFSHYNDGRWVLTRVTYGYSMGFHINGNVTVTE